jgi:hypothetical protein
MIRIASTLAFRQPHMFDAKWSCIVSHNFYYFEANQILAKHCDAILIL